jgi:hypothetical protein
MSKAGTHRSSPGSACDSYAAGHHVHWIQALHTANKPEIAAQSCHGVVRAVSSHQLLVRPDDGSVPVLLWHHDAARLAEVASRTMWSSAGFFSPRSIPPHVRAGDAGLKGKGLLRDTATQAKFAHTMSERAPAGGVRRSCPPSHERT